MQIHLWAPGFTGFGGGITVFSRELALALRGNDHDLRLFGKADRSGEWEGLPLQGAEQWPDGLTSLGFSSTALFSCFRHRPVSIISSHLNFGPVAHLANKTMGVPYTLVAHGIDIHSALSRSRLAALRSAERVVAVSTKTRERVLELGGIEPARVVVLPNTYDESRFCVSNYPAGLAERYGIRDDEKVILTVARLALEEGYKGYDRILQALPAIRKTGGLVRYLIAGKGEDRKRLEVMASDLGVADSVTFVGFVPDEELADHYRLADVFAMPSTGEGFGIVFLESMGCGTPALGGNIDGSVDALDNGKLGLLVDPMSVDAIGEGLVSLLQKEGPELWFNRKNLSSAVREKYGREAFRRRVAEIFGSF